MEAALIPLPTELTTPPVTNTYLVNLSRRSLQGFVFWCDAGSGGSNGLRINSQQAERAIKKGDTSPPNPFPVFRAVRPQHLGDSREDI